jgi:maleamate amidohydrolase
VDAGTHELYDAAGLGRRQGPGRAAGLVVVDLSLGFTSPESPLCCDEDGVAVAAAGELLTAARAGGRPVAFTTVAYDAGTAPIAAAFVAKVPDMVDLLAAGTPFTEIDPRLAPLPAEPVFTKLFPSGFAGTPLAQWFAAHGLDTAVICGASTSGCVRATASDALGAGLRVVVAREAVADRAEGPHRAALFDVDQKIGDVVSLAEACALLAGVPVPV